MSVFMAYVLLVSGAIAAAAALAERVLDAYGRPIRGVWLGALVASVGVPVLASALQRGERGDAAAAALAEAGEPGGELASATLEAAPPSFGSGIDWQQWAEWAEWSGWRWLIGGASSPSFAALDDVLMLLWIAASAAVLCIVAAGWAALQRPLHRLPRARIEGVEVAVSERLGPGVYGVLEPRIVVPRWLLDASPAVQAAVIRHERSHIAAHDTRWLGAAMLAVAMLSWNPLTWWMLRRFRAALEIDCDARVVRRGGAEPGAYVSVLLWVARRRAAEGRRLPIVGAAVSTGSTSQLERRVRRLLDRRTPNRASAALSAAAAALTFVAACAVEPPAASSPEPTAGEAGRARLIEAAREPLTSLALDGERVAVLVDVSASMLDRTAEGVERRLGGSREERRRAPKWQHLVETVESVTARIPSGSRFQLILFAEQAHAAIPGTEAQWLSATENLLERAVDSLRRDVAGEGRSNLRAAFDAAAMLQPPPDVIHLVVDGLPNAASETAAAPANEQERMALFTDAVAAAPADAAVNVILLPKEGEAIAAPAFWTLTQATGGALLAPAEDATRSAVPGVPLDAEYLIFIVDTSGSMRMYAWDRVQRQILETIERHVNLEGIQVMSDEGEYLLQGHRGTWIPNAPSELQSIRDGLSAWRAFSNSSPSEGIAVALRTFDVPGKRVSLYVLGDDLAGGSIEAILEAVEESNRDRATGAARMRINAVVLPVYLEVAGELLSSAEYAMLMRDLTLHHGGALLAPASLRERVSSAD
jgi:hypothetical protein